MFEIVGGRLLFIPGVMIVSDRLLGRLRGEFGGGFVKADLIAAVAGSLSAGLIRGTAVLTERAVFELPVVFTARFFRLRGFLPGVEGLCRSKNGADCEFVLISSNVRGRGGSTTMDISCGFAIGDSGEEPGDISVTLESSFVEAVVVGEEPAESEADVEVLS